MQSLSPELLTDRKIPVTCICSRRDVVNNLQCVMRRGSNWMMWLRAERQSLIITADGQRSLADERRYPELRNTPMSRGIDPPAVVFTHPSLNSFLAAIKRLKTKDLGFALHGARLPAS